MLAISSLSLSATSAVLMFMVLVPRAEAQICQPRTSGNGKECFVSLTGSDGGQALRKLSMTLRVRRER